jgi:hypothetical protein
VKKLFVLSTTLAILTCLTACTYNVSMAHTQGTATDTIDDTASNTPNVSPNVTVPLTPGSEIKVTK